MSRDRISWIRGGALLCCTGLLTCCIDAACADPPLSFDSAPVIAGVATTSPAPSDALPPTIATVTLQTVTREDASGVVPVGVDADTGIRFEDLPREIGAHVRVTTLGQRVHRGVVRAADAHRLTLSTSQHGGSATYVLQREQIQRIDPD